VICDNHPTGLDVFRFDKNPRIVVLDFARLAEQGAMLNRVAAMAEKNGLPHDRALDDATLDQAIRAGGDTPETFYYGHDYGAGELTRFFAATDRQRLELTQGEGWLRQLLEQDGTLQSGGAIGLISIPAAGAGGVTIDMRRTILHHELSHGEYFTNPAYAAWTLEFWSKVLDTPTREAFRKFLTSENYDPQIETLMAPRPGRHERHGNPRSAAAVPRGDAGGLAARRGDGRSAIGCASACCAPLLRQRLHQHRIHSHTIAARIRVGEGPPQRREVVGHRLVVRTGRGKQRRR
jgi:hypothetical protein